MELGWPAIPFSEEDGGMGWGLPEICIVMEALGQHLAKTPMLSVMLAGILDPEAGAVEGQVVALASREGAPHQGPETGPCTTRVENGRITGTKVPVLDGMAADVSSGMSKGEAWANRFLDVYALANCIMDRLQADTGDFGIGPPPAG